MKNLYIIILSLFCINVFAQDILGEWQLIFIEVDGERQYSTIPNSDNYIIFGDDSLAEGGVCSNGYYIEYEQLTANTFVSLGGAALAGTCNYEVETDVFLHPYLWDVLLNIDADNLFDYVINGTGNNQTLQITNSLGNLAFYNREGLPENRLTDVWYLHEISVDNVIIENTFNPLSSIEFTTNNSFLFGIEYLGVGVCNDFFGAYNLETPSTFILEYFDATLAVCDNDEGSNFEVNYFSLIANTQPQTIIFNISGTGNDEVLTLTNPDGDYALYGRESLSIDENFFNISNITLKKNPVQNKLYLQIGSLTNSELQYTIYTLDGKERKAESHLQSDSINVNNLESGIYFLKLFSVNGTQILKFIKS